MAEPFLVAMNHSEWHAKNVLKKFHRNRALGEIELQYRYKPAQPVLSSRTVDIDSCGTRTYRAKNTIDIIEEQHKLIHEIYTKARNISSAPPGGQRINQRSAGAERNSKGLHNLRVTGSNNAISQSRPTSGKSDFIILKTRPNTTGSHKRRAHAAVETELKFDLDPTWETSNDALHSTRHQIQRNWKPEQRMLNKGRFVRGNTDQPSVASTLDPRAASNWLSFGGGQQDRNSGVVDAFTAMKHDGQFYTIDGSTGTVVARQLQRGDKIRIGVNGQVPPSDYRIKEHEQNVADDASSVASSVKRERPVVPLCWTDQVDREDTIILPCSFPKQQHTKQNQNETTPVTFKKFGVDGSRPPIGKSRGVRVVEGYSVKQRTTSRTNIDGSRSKPSSRVTHISVNKNSTGDSSDDMTYEEVLDMRIKNKSSISGPFIHDEVEIAGRKLNNTVLSSKGAPEQLKSDSRTTMTDSSRRGSARVRPMSTISSSGAADFGGYVIGAPSSQESHRMMSSPLIPNGNDDDNVSRRSVGRKKSGGASRPPPLKPNLHKTAAATGTSINSIRGGNKQNTEYISMAQQLCINKDHMGSCMSSETEPGGGGGGHTPRGNPNAVIRSVSDYNKPVKEKDVKFKEDMEEIIPDDFSRQCHVHGQQVLTAVADDNSSGDNNIERVTQHSCNDSDVNETNNNSEAATTAQLNDSNTTIDMRYAFNIPTAGHDLDPDIMTSGRLDLDDDAIKDGDVTAGDQ